MDGTEPLVVLNTTVAGNKSASNGGGIFADGSSVVRLNSVTVVRNRGNTDGMFSEAGGGLFSDVPAGDFVVRNSIVSSNAVTDSHSRRPAGEERLRQHQRPAVHCRSATTC